MDEFKKKQKIDSWKRLGRLVLIILGFIIALLFFISYSYEEDEAEKAYSIGEDEKEILHELQEGN